MPKCKKIASQSAKQNEENVSCCGILLRFISLLVSAVASSVLYNSLYLHTKCNGEIFNTNKYWASCVERNSPENQENEDRESSL